MDIMVESGIMPDIREYKTIKDAAADERVPYTPYWLRRLAKAKTVVAVQVGDGKRSQWLIHMPSLLEYVRKMARLGTKKHHPD